MPGQRQLVELGAFGSCQLPVVLGAAAVPQPVERLPLLRRRLEILAPAPTSSRLAFKSRTATARRPANRSR